LDDGKGEKEYHFYRDRRRMEQAEKP